MANIRVVLVETSHPGNIGAAARAMKNMCLEELVLVNPHVFPSADATARASGADDILSRARVVENLDQAIQGCGLVVACSARPRTISWQPLQPRACAELLVRASATAPAAIVFGRERAGLSNAEVDRCQHLVAIPSNPDYPSLNLGAAVQVMAYEILMAGGEVEPVQSEQKHPPATSDEMERFFTHLEETLTDLEFLDPDNPRQLMRRLRRVFHRARIDTNELSMLRGILTAAQQKSRGRSG